MADTPDFGRDAYLAISENEIALVKAKHGAMKPKITDEVHARAPREPRSRTPGTGAASWRAR